MTTTEKYLTLSRVAKETGIARTSLYTHIQRGHLKASKVGFYTLVAPADVAAFKKRLKRISFGDRTVVVFQEA